MKAVAVRHVEADEMNKAAASLDARMQSSVNKQNYTPKQQAQADRMLQAVQDCYSSSKDTYLNYRKTMVSIKVAKPFELRDRKWLRVLEAQWAQQGVVKKDSAQGITYCIPKA